MHTTGTSPDPWIPKLEVRLVTPEYAAYLLESSAEATFDTSYGINRNRAISQGTVDKYAAMMRVGQWRMTSAAIELTSDGYLINGQHRMHAVVRAGVPVMMAFCDDVPPSNFDVIDTGRVRTSGAFIEGPYASYTASVSKALMRLAELRGEADSSLPSGSPSVQEHLKYVTDHPGIRQYVIAHGNDASYACRLGFSGTSRTGLLLAGYILSPAQRETWWADIRSMANGLPVENANTNPVRALWKVGGKEPKSNSGNRTALSYLRALYAAVRYRDGIPLTKIQDTHCAKVRVY